MVTSFEGKDVVVVVVGDTSVRIAIEDNGATIAIIRGGETTIEMEVEVVEVVEEEVGVEEIRIKIGIVIE